MTTQVTPTLESTSSTPVERPTAPARRARLWLGVTAVVLLLVLLGGASAIVIRNELDPGAPVSGVTEVAIREQDFDPPAIEIPAGTTVTWRWASTELHNVVGNDFASPNQTDGTFTQAFAAPGTYDYRCTLHFFMRGQVVVGDEGPRTKD
jgi:plastocyanin